MPGWPAPVFGTETVEPGGRLLLGVLADRLGAKPVLVTGLLVQALAIATYLYVNRLGEFYALSIVFGTAYGGVMPLYALSVGLGAMAVALAFPPLPSRSRERLQPA